MITGELKNIAEGLINIFNQAGQESIDLRVKGLEVKIKDDNSPVSNGDLKVNDLITNKIKELTPNIPIISEETVDIKKENKEKIFWLIDPIDGTKEYIAGRDHYTLNAALIIANGEYDIYAAKERANEWDYAAGHAIAEHAGAIINTLDGKPFLYGKADYKNSSILIKRAKNLND